MKAGALAALALTLHLSGVQALACPANADLTVRDLLGRWRAEFAGPGARPAIDLLLEPNPEWRASFAGHFQQAGRQVQVAGDLEDGVFTLEESADGVRIDATWTGQPVEGSCGREIRGSWRAAGDAANATFVLRRRSGW